MHLSFSEDAAKHLQHLSKSNKVAAKQIHSKIKILATNPYYPDTCPIQGMPEGYRRIRAGKFRIVYLVEESQLTIKAIGHRDNIYRSF